MSESNYEFYLQKIIDDFFLTIDEGMKDKNSGFMKMGHLDVIRLCISNLVLNFFIKVISDDISSDGALKVIGDFVDFIKMTTLTSYEFYTEAQSNIKKEKIN